MEKKLGRIWRNLASDSITNVRFPNNLFFTYFLISEDIETLLEGRHHIPLHSG
jgi:hypothetical protein